MLPAPARMAAPPRLRSSVSWKPAVPPPPVAGAAVGYGLLDGVGVGVGVGVGDCDGVADAVSEGLADAVSEGLAVPPDEVSVGVGDPLPDAEPPGEREGGVAEGVPPEQAESDTEASTVRAAQPAALNLPLNLVPAIVVRMPMRPPHASGGWLTRFSRSGPGRPGRFPWSRHHRPASERKSRGRPGRCLRPEAGPRKRRSEEDTSEL